MPIYTIVPALALALLSGILKREIGGVFSLNYDISLLFGIALIISGLGPT